MSDKKLTQEEIDDLINMVESGGTAAMDDYIGVSEDRNYNEYDFDRPDKFNPENLKNLRTIATTFAKNFSQELEASIKLPTSFRVNAEIEQVPYAAEYVEKLPKNYYVFCVTELGAKNLGKIILEFDLNLIVPIHKKMMGARHVQIEDKRRMLTEIEQISLQQCLEKWAFPHLKDAFKNVVDLDLKLKKIEMDAQYAKITTATDMLALISFDVILGEQKTTMRLCIPYMSIEPIMGKLTTENIYDFKISEYSEQQYRYLEQHLEQTPQRVDIELGKSQISLKELIDFSVGDVMLLDKKTEQDLIGYISGMAKFSCKMGRKDNKVAVKITRFAEKAGVDNE